MEGQKVQFWNKHGGANQRWKIVYLDQSKISKQTKGVDTDTGFHINRPFYIRSRLPMKRVAEAVGNNTITLKRWAKNRKAQKWTYDSVRKVIMNMNWTNYGIQIPSNGGANDLRITSGINSKWF